MALCFHLSHIVPEKAHFPQGYAEIIETIGWGLQQLGHEITYGRNNFRPGLRNIVVGAQMLELPFLESLPRDTIIYNLEQMSGASPADVPLSYRYCAENFLIWDYS